MTKLRGCGPTHLLLLLSLRTVSTYTTSTRTTVSPEFTRILKRNQNSPTTLLSKLALTMLPRMLSSLSRLLGMIFTSSTRLKTRTSRTSSPTSLIRSLPSPLSEYLLLRAQANVGILRYLDCSQLRRRMRREGTGLQPQQSLLL